MAGFEHLIGRALGEGTWSWDADKAMLYAVGVGAGLEDPLEERQFTTDNSPGIAQQVIPTFLAIMGNEGSWMHLLELDDRDPTYPVGVVHGDQSVTLARPIPPQGTVHYARKVAEVYDKGSGALIIVEMRITLADSGEHLGTWRMGLFALGKGGFGGPRNPPGEQPWVRPERDPDLTVSLPIGLNQSLIYRLTGDKNPHGTDPERAKGDGFDRPVFYGLGSFGVACRALLRGLCDGDAAGFGHFYARFSKAVHPGDRLDTQIWRTDGGAIFQTLANGDRLVLDRGIFRFAGAQ